VGEPLATLALVVGVLTILAGLVLSFLGIRYLGRSLSPLPKPLASAELIDHGVYRHIRHPIYSGLMLAALGWSVLGLSLAAFALTVVLAVVLDLKSRREEAWLRDHFDGYAAYAARTRRFVPGLY
jgi:protein-S-isoprenylcysteine O-methyltransferase Ste14